MPLNFLRDCFTVDDEPMRRRHPRALHVGEEYVEPMSSQIRSYGEHRNAHHRTSSPSRAALNNSVYRDDVPSLVSSADQDESFTQHPGDLDHYLDLSSRKARHQPIFFDLVKEFFDNLRCRNKNTCIVTQKNKSVQFDGNTNYSPLRTATHYEECKTLDDIPSIALEEVVMPGSMLQRQMSLNLQKNGVVADLFEDECVICMEPFDESNPQIRTLCGCGKNKALFHLPCLFQWIDKSSECPSCRKKLVWEEF